MDRRDFLCCMGCAGMAALVGCVTTQRHDGKGTNMTTKKTELKAFTENIDFIQRETGLKVNIQDADNPTADPEGRATKALPGRPALYLS